MSPKLTPSAVALALSACAVVGGNIISSAGEVNSPEALSDGNGNIVHHRREEAEEIILNKLDIGGSNTEVDVGILSGNDGSRHHDNIPLFRHGFGFGIGMSPRFLQEEVLTCPYPETCEPNLCACTGNGVGNGYTCAAELNAVCNKVTDVNGTVWTIDGCTGDTKYYRKAWCPFAECIVNGGTYGTCYCKFYETVCEIYGDRNKYEVSSYFRLTCSSLICSNDRSSRY